MSGVARTLDKYEKYGSVGDIKGAPGTVMSNKERYAKSRGVEEDRVRDEGYLALHQEKLESETKKAEEQATAQAQAAKAASEAAILEKSQESQKAALKRKGRRASILTSSQGTDPLGIPGV